MRAIIIAVALLALASVAGAEEPKAMPTEADLAACFQYANVARQETEIVRARLEMERALVAKERDALKAELAALKKAAP